MRLLPQPDRLDLGEAVPPMPIKQAVWGSIVFGFAAMFLAVGGFGIWAAAAPIASAVLATGKLTVATKRKQVQHYEGGIIHRVAVKDGDHVGKDDVLIELDVTRSKGRFAMARLGYLAAAAAEARLTAERDALSDLHFPADVVREAKIDLEVAVIMRNQRLIFAARQLEYRNQMEILGQRIKRLADQIKGIEAERAAAEQQLVLADEEATALEALYRKNLTTRQRVLQIRREAVQLKGQIGRLSAETAAAQKEIGETELNLAQLKQRRNTDILSELKDIQTKVLELRQLYQTYGNELERTTVRAPVSGTVVGLQVHTVGGVVRSGETLLEIVPERDQLVVEVRVRPTDIDNVGIGQQTEVRFSAFKSRNMPTLQGQVASVSADALGDPDNQAFYYLAEITVDTSELARLGKVKLQPGMPAEVMIQTGSRTALEYLIQPLAESVNRAWREN